MCVMHIISIKSSQPNNISYQDYFKRGKQKRSYNSPKAIQSTGMGETVTRGVNVPASRLRPYWVLTEHWLCARSSARIRVYSGEQRQSLLSWSLETTNKELEAALGQTVPLTLRKGARSAADLQLVGSSGLEVKRMAPRGQSRSNAYPG